MATIEERDVDVEHQAHLKANLNNHIWVHDDTGVEQSIHTMSRKQVVDIYNDLLKRKYEVLYQDDWLRILNNKLAPIT